MRGKLNAINREEEAYLVNSNLDKVQMSMAQVWRTLIGQKIQPMQTGPKIGHGIFSKFHKDYGKHNIQKCQTFQAKI